MKTAEEIIKSKNYIELTSKEREVVGELVANEDEFEAMKWFLLETESSFAAEKIEASSNLRNNVMAHLNSKQGAPKVFWLNGVSAFLFPENKKFYQYPALQIAAVAVLLISVVSVYNYNQNLNQDLAINQPVANDTDLKDGETVTTINTEMSEDKNDDKSKLNEPIEVKNDEITLENNLKSNLGKGSEETPAQAAYFKQLSAAEENKIVMDDAVMPADELESDVALYDNNTERLNQAVPANTQEKVVLQETQTLDMVSSKNESSYRKENTKKENKREGDKSVSLSSDAPESFATVNDSTAVNSKDRDQTNGGYFTGSAGGVYGETASEDVTTTGTSKPDQDETGKQKVSVADSKLIKKLLFTVK